LATAKPPWCRDLIKLIERAADGGWGLTMRVLALGIPILVLVAWLAWVARVA
jgi:hypothetical protein